jgi:hypothetical protein
MNQLEQNEIIEFQQNDGGREEAGFVGKVSVRDCVVRAIAIATEKPYREVYEALSKSGKSPRNGVRRSVYEKYLASLGWKFYPTMGIGTGCKVHLKASELPKGRIICRVSKHLVAVIDGVIHDTYNPSRDGTRCVYGYYKKI